MIADFYLPEFEVVIEIDGQDHYKEDRLIYDEYRTKFLINRCGINEVVRFKNKDIRDNLGEIEKELYGRFCLKEKDHLSELYFATMRK